MKTNFKISLIIIVAAVCAVTLSACKKKNEMGRMNVAMTDAPALYTHVYVDVKAVNVHSENAGWVNLPVNQGVYDLLTLQNNVSVVLVNNVNFPVGRISQIRMDLGSNNSLVDTLGTKYPLAVPSGSESGLKVNVQQDIVPNSSVDVLLDFDANASVVAEGNGRFSLKPVIKVKSIITH